MGDFLFFDNHVHHLRHEEYLNSLVRHFSVEILGHFKRIEGHPGGKLPALLGIPPEWGVPFPRFRLWEQRNSTLSRFF